MDMDSGLVCGFGFGGACGMAHRPSLTHQIRVHCAYVGHPLLGDEMYGAPVTENIRRAALHCKSVTFIHPVSGEKLTFTANEPDDMKKELKKAEIIVDKPNNIC